MDSLPETYKEPQFYIIIVSNFSLVLQWSQEKSRTMVVPFFLSIFLEGGGYTRWIMVSLKIVDMVKMRWV